MYAVSAEIINVDVDENFGTSRETFGFEKNYYAKLKI